MPRAAPRRILSRAGHPSVLALSSSTKYSHGAIYINCDMRSMMYDGKLWTSDLDMAPNSRIERRNQEDNASMVDEPSEENVDIYSVMRSFEGMNYATYSIDVNASAYYKVSLHFAAEQPIPSASSRQFNVYLQNSLVLEEFSPETVAGSVVVKSFYAPSGTDGKLNIAFEKGSKGSPVISAIEIVPSAGLYSVDPASGSVLTWEEVVSCGATKAYGPDKAARVWSPANDYVVPVKSLFNMTTASSGMSAVQGTEVSPMFLPLQMYLTTHVAANSEFKDSNDALVYRMPATPGSSYFVRLHFVEPLRLLDGMRKINVFINGEQLVEDLDIVAEVGIHVPLVKDFTVAATSTVMEIKLTATRTATNNDPLLSGFELLRIMPFANATAKAIAAAPVLTAAATPATEAEANQVETVQQEPCKSVVKAWVLWTGVAIGVIAFAAACALAYVGLLFSGRSICITSKAGAVETDLEAIKVGNMQGASIGAPQAVPIPRDATGSPLLTRSATQTRG